MVAPEERVEIRTARGIVGGAWAQPSGTWAVLVIAHGAGAGMDHPFLVGFTRAVNAGGVATLRFNFPYMESGRRSPDPQPVLGDAWLGAFDLATSRAANEPVLVGGKSLGGRIASVLVADGMPASGLVFLGYPLHPPGRPGRIRDEHLYRVPVPMLFLQGTLDPFARPDLLGEVLERLGDRATYRPVEGGNHSFRVKGARADDREIGASLAPLVLDFMRRAVG